MKRIFLFLIVSISIVAVAGCQSKDKPIPIAKPAVIPPSKVMTLSQQQLLLLDWHSPHHRGARIMSKKLAAGGVEFNVSFPSNNPGNVSVDYVSSGEGGNGDVVGGDISGFRSFALKFTLVSINGKSEPELKQKVVVGAAIGPTAEGLVQVHSPVTLSMAEDEKTVIAQTSIRSDNIRTIGFHIHAPNPEDWDTLQSEVKILVEPVPDGGVAPWWPPVPEEDK